MKFAKKLGLASVVLVMISLLAAMTVFASDADKKQAILNYLNITSLETDLEVEASRADLARMFAEATAEGDIASLVDSTVVINDVPSYSDNYNYIAYLYKIGLVCGDSNGNFEPDSPVVPEHAAKLAAKLLGMMKTQDETYTQLLGRTGIYISSSANGYMTKENIADLIYDMLMHKTYDAEYTGGTVTSTTLGKETYLEKVFAIYEVDGIVSENYYSSLYGKSALEANELKINEIVFKNMTENNDLFAKNISGFYKHNKSGDYELICAWPSGNNIVSINTDKIVSYKNKQYEYSKSEYDNKYKKASLANGVTVIYNGMFVSGTDGLEDKDMIPKSGFVTLIDNNSDGKYDVVLINSYINGIFNGYNSDKSLIYTNNGNYEYDDDNFVITDTEGNALSLSAIKKGSVISIGQSINKDSTVAIVSEKTVEGNIEQIGNDYVMIGDAMFYYDDAVKDDMQLWSSGTFYINFEGKIVHADVANSTGWFYAYMVDAAEENFGALKFRVYTEDGKIIDYKVNGKFYIDGKYEKWTLDGAVGAIQNSNGKFKGLVRCAINSDGLLTHIDTVNNVSYTNDDTLISISSVGSNMSFRDNMLGCRFVVGSNTKIFVIPDENDVNTYYMISRSEMKSEKTYDVSAAYKIDKDSFLADAVVITQSEYILASDRAQHLTVVEDIRYALNADGDTVCKLIISNDKLNKYEILTESKNTLYDRTAGLTVNKGDLIRYGYSKDGYIDDDNIILVYSRKSDWHLSSIDSTAMDNYMCVKVAYVYDVDDGYMQVQLTDPATSDDSADRYFLSLSKAVIYTIDSDNNVSKATTSDIKSWVKNSESALVAFHAEYGSVFCLYIYE